MTTAQALTDAMKERGLRDEDVAVACSIRAITVWKYRVGRSEPSRPIYDRLRRFLPSFAERMDREAVA